MPKSRSALAKRSSTSSAPVRRKRRRSTRARVRLARIRARSAASAPLTQQLITVGTPAAVQMLSDSGVVKLPVIAGVNPSLMWGGLLALFADDIFGSGALSKNLSAAGLGLAAAGAAEVAKQGTVLTGDARSVKKAKAAKAASVRQKHRAMGDEDVGDDELGDDEIGDDELGDDEIGDDELGDDE